MCSRPEVRLGAGERDLALRSQACQWRAELEWGVGDELALRVIGVLERLQDTPGHEASEAKRDQRAVRLPASAMSPHAGRRLREG
jgi:hypothetical protein